MVPMPKRKLKGRALTVEAAGVSATICRYSIEVTDEQGRQRTWRGDTVEGFVRDLAESSKEIPK